jgi:hypothetical protein
MKYIDRLKQRAEEKHTEYKGPKRVGGEVGNESIFFMGTEPMFDEVLLNEGPASTGVKVTVTGSALSQLVDLKRPLGAWSFDHVNGRVLQHREAPFVHIGENKYVAIIQDIQYDDVLELAFKASLWKFTGVGDLRIEVQPLAGNQATIWESEVTVGKTEY